MLYLLYDVMSETDELSRKRKVSASRYHPVSNLALDERLTALEADIERLEQRVAKLERKPSALTICPHEKSML